jgi:2'-5' RNA ligase
MQTCKAIEKTIGRKLTNRGEAHITVVTPLEFDQVLKPFLTIEEINKIAKDNSIQESSFDILCIGSGRKELDGVNEETFFFVVESPDLLKIRHKIQEAFEAAGGKKSLFNGNYFFPHITIGFTKRDLHISDQVIKDDRSMDARFRILIGI